MIQKATPSRHLPDIALDALAPVHGALDQVGMSAIETLISIPFGSKECLIPAKADAFVSLDKAHTKGIHMSRLFSAIQEGLQSQSLSPALITQLLEKFLKSHSEVSGASYISVHFELPVMRKALLSQNEGIRFYPCFVKGRLKDRKLLLQLGLTITYSSTCPCSAALARHIVQGKFLEKFGKDSKVDTSLVAHWLSTEEGMCATPHSQRSQAVVQLTLDPKTKDFGFISLIDSIENALKTPVQAAVKREDEQEFTRLNGQNLMFCEDAARRIKELLDNDTRFVDYHIRAAHYESLHPHDAVATATKGIKDGFSA